MRPRTVVSTDLIRRSMRTSTLDGLFAVQYLTLTSGPLLTAFLLALGASAFQVGLVASLPLLGGLLQPFGAEVIRQRGGWRKPVCLTAVLIDNLLWGASLAAVFWLDPATAVAVVIGVLALQQAASAFAGVAWTSWISDLVPPSLRGRYFSRRNFISNGFGAVTAVLAGQAIRAAGEATIPVFLSMIALAMGARLVSFFYLRQQAEPRPAQSIQGGFRQQFRKPLTHPGFRWFLMFGMAWGFTVNLASPFFAVYMLEQMQLGADHVLFFAALGTTANLLGQRFWGPRCDRYGDRQILRVTSFFVAVQPLWWLFTAPTGWGYVLMPLLSAFGGFIWGGNALALGNLMMRLAPEAGKTTFFAVQAAAGGLFGALGPLAGGLLAEAFGTTGGLALIAPLLGLKSLFFLSFLARTAAWGLLRWVPEPTEKPNLRAVLLLRDAFRTLNPAQGFSPLLHVFAEGPRKRLVKKRDQQKEQQRDDERPHEEIEGKAVAPIVPRRRRGREKR